MDRRLAFLVLMLGLIMAASGAMCAELSPTLSEILPTAADNELLPVVIFLDARLTMDEVYPDARRLPMDERRSYIVNALKERFAQMSPRVMERLETAKKAGEATLLRPLWILNAVRTKASASVLRELQEYPETIYLTYDPRWENTLDDGWGVTEIGALELQDQYGVTGEGVIVGHKDSGLNYDFEEFAGRIWINPGEDLDGNGNIDEGETNGIDDDGNGYVDDFRGWNFEYDNNNVHDIVGHGTKTGSVISSNPGRCERISCAPGAKLMLLLGYVTEGAVWESSQYAMEMGANVISASVSFKQSNCASGVCPNRVAHRWVSEMELAAGMIHANSTGNAYSDSGNPIPLNAAAPADCPPPAMLPGHPLQGGVSSVVGVAAYLQSGAYYTGSERGPCGWSRVDQCVQPRSPFCGPEGTAWAYPAEFEDYPYLDGAFPGLLKPDVTAPSSVAALAADGTCNTIGQTSGATPHVGGTLALIYSAFPGITPEEAYVRLIEGAIDAGDPGPDNMWGFGKLDALNAITPGLASLGNVSGTVLSEGVPVPGVRITAGDRQPVHTDEDGDYEVWIEPGTYTLEFYRYGYQSAAQSDVTVSAGGTTTLNVLLPEAVTGSLVITLEDEGQGWGPGLGNLSVTISEGGPSGVTNGDGLAEFPLIYAGTHEIVIGAHQEFYEIARQEITLGAGPNARTIPLTLGSYAFPTGTLENEGYIAYDDLDRYGPQFDWEEINPDLGGSGELLPFTGDACITRTLPFEFGFYGQAYTQIAISPNGYVVFGTGCPNTWEMFPIPRTEAPNGYCAAWMQDFEPEEENGGSVYFRAEGSQAIIEWYDVRTWEFYGYGRATFQMILTDEDAGFNGSIVCQYNDIQGHIEGTTGVENQDGTNGLQYGYHYHYADGAAPLREGRVILFSPDVLIAADEPVNLPNTYALHQNYPNPFNPTTTFSFEAPRAGQVKLSLFDLLGREAAVVFDGNAAAGVNRVEFDAAELATGVYFARLQATGSTVGVKKVMLLR